jgi:CubicO group peptidase (beta-lactamase class C family)
MTLHSIGSSGRYTPRALATIGELFLRGGEWDGRQILDAKWVTRALTYAQSPPVPPVHSTEPAAGLGWWVNTLGLFPSLPRDAALGAGASSRILLVVPSLHLVAVWTAEASFSEATFWADLERELFAPLMSAVAAQVL